MKPLVIILLFVLSCCDLKSQQVDKEVIVKQDSALFYRLKMNESVCPMPDFDNGFATFQFLKRQKARILERRKRVSATWEKNDDGTVEYEVMTFYRGDDELKFRDGVQLKQWRTYKKKWMESFASKHLATYDERTEKQELEERLKAFSSIANFKPLFFKTIDEKFHGDIALYVESLYKKSLLNNAKSLKRFLRAPKMQRLDKDMGAQMSIAIKMYQIWLENWNHIAPEKIGLFVYRP